jgi:hypothetical protein
MTKEKFVELVGDLLTEREANKANEESVRYNNAMSNFFNLKKLLKK